MFWVIEAFYFSFLQLLEPIDDESFGSFQNPTYAVSPE